MTTESTLDFRCCDTRWRIQARGAASARAVSRARDVAVALESVLNAFDASSAVARLNREGETSDLHVARVVERAAEYRARTRGAFDVGRGALEHAVKAYIRGQADAPCPVGTPARYHVVGHTVTATAPLDLNGIAKGYIVDRVHEALEREGVEGFVDGGGDIASPTGPVGIESPYGEGLVGVLDTRWNVATSGKARRRRGRIDHIYDARDGHIGARHDQVTVVAKRDCTEADVLATTLAALPLEEGISLLDDWQDVEALWIRDGQLTMTTGFEDHVWKA